MIKKLAVSLLLLGCKAPTVNVSNPMAATSPTDSSGRDTACHIGMVETTNGTWISVDDCSGTDIALMRADPIGRKVTDHLAAALQDQYSGGNSRAEFNKNEITGAYSIMVAHCHDMGDNNNRRCAPRVADSPKPNPFVPPKPPPPRPKPTAAPQPTPDPKFTSVPYPGVGTFDTSLESKLLQVPGHVNIEETFSDNQIAGAVSAGLVVAEMINGGPLASSINRTATSVVANIRTLIHGGAQPDAKSDAAIRQTQVSNVAALSALRNFYNNMAQSTRRATEQVKVDLRMVAGLTQGTSSLLEKQIAELRQQLASNQTKLETIESTVTTIPGIITEAARREDETSRVNKGAMPATVVNQLKGFMRSTTPLSAMEQLAAYQQLYDKETNPLKKEQYRQIIGSMVDDNGLVPEWVSQAEISPLGLTSVPNGRRDQVVRQNFNEAIGNIATGFEQHYSPFAAVQVLQAQASFTKNDRLWGNRKLNRARTMLDYVANHPRINDYRAVRLSSQAMQLFSMNPGYTAEQYENYEVIQVANYLADSLGSSPSEDAKLLAMLTFDQAKLLAQQGDLGRFVDQADAGFSLGDFLSGVSKGFRGAANGTWETTLASLGYLANNDPIHLMWDVSEGLSAAIINHDKIYNAVVAKIEKFIKDVPNYTEEQWGKFVGNMAFEVATGVALGGAPKITAVLTKEAVIMRDIAKVAVGKRKLAGVLPYLAKVEANPYSSRRVNSFVRGLVSGPSMFDGADIVSTSAKITVEQAKTFAGSQYRSGVLQKPKTVVRYFTHNKGSIIMDSKARARGTWHGSRLYPDVDDFRAGSAVKEAWNDPVYIMQYEVAPGAEVVYGSIGQQVDVGGKVLAGGDMQIGFIVDGKLAGWDKIELLVQKGVIKEVGYIPSGFYDLAAGAW